MTETTPRLRFHDGKTIPQLGIGTYKMPESTAPTAVRQAYDIGYRLVDTAALYQNERGVGEAIKGLDDIFVTTKLWNDRQGHDEAIRAFEESLALLGRETIDLYLIHWPTPAQDKYVESWKALIRLRDEGRVSSIGVSNFLPEHLERIIGETGEVPVLNQIELHPDFQQKEQRAFHEKHDIVTQSWSPLGQGRTLENPVFAEIAKKHDRSPAQVILRWHLDSGLAVIPKATSEAHLRDNFGVLGFALDEEDMARIAGLDDPDGRIGPDPATM